MRSFRTMEIRELAMSRRILGVASALLLAGAFAEAQFIFPGSTPVGDYLRGVGIAAYGMGIYNERTAVANRINAETFIMLNEYMWNVVKNEMRENAEHRRRILAKKAVAYRKIQERIHDHPEPLDVMNGAALNSMLRELLSPTVVFMAPRDVKIPLDADVIRRIPFQLGEKGERFSMARLSPKGKKPKWVVAFQDDRFATYCRGYERAVDNALGLATDGKMEPGAIEDLQKAVEHLQFKLDHTPEFLEPRNQRRYHEAKEQLDRLRLSARLFQTFKMQSIFAEIDTYAGRTVNELTRFMSRHGLTFAEAETPEERTLYRQLYTALVEQRNLSIRR